MASKSRSRSPVYSRSDKHAHHKEFHHSSGRRRQKGPDEISSRTPNTKLRDTTELTSDTRRSEGRNDSRSEGRHDSRSEGRHDSRSEGRHESRSEGRHENRSEGRHESRSEGRHESRSEGRHESRSEGRHESRSEGRHESRSEGRHESRSEGRHESRSEGRHESRSEGRHESRSEGRHESRSEGRPSDRLQGRTTERKADRKSEEDSERHSNRSRSERTTHQSGTIERARDRTAQGGAPGSTRNQNQNPTEFKYGKDKDSSKPQQPKEEPNYKLSGKLAAEHNTYKGVVIKYSEPPEARKPKVRWSLYPFKGEEELPVLYIHRQSAYLIGRNRNIVDIPVDHPSCSGQHAVLQYRLVEVTKEDGTTGRAVRPYLIDIGSTNGTFINSERIEVARYFELKEKDVIKFGFSTREYVVLHENSVKDLDNEDET